MKDDDTLNFGELVDGDYVGSMHPALHAIFEKAVEHGYAARSYTGVAGLLGLARVRLIRQEPEI